MRAAANASLAPSAPASALRSKAALEPAPDTWLALAEAMLDAVWLVDARSLQLVGANQAAGRLHGTPAQQLVGLSVLDLAPTPEDLCFWSDVAAGAHAEIESDSIVQRDDGHCVPVTRRVTRVEAEPGRALCVVTLHDRTAQVRAERDLEAAVADLQSTLESTADGILVTDLAGRIRSFNQRFAKMWNVPAELLMRRDDDGVLDWMRRCVNDPSGYMRRLSVLDEATLMHSSDVLELTSGSVVERVTQPQCARGQPVGRVYSFRDITDKVRADEQIRRLTHTDALTGLPNRRRLTEHIEFAIAMSRRDGQPFALLFANLDRFKHINETLGHGFGDRVLLDVAERMKSCMRMVDIVARLGGDEFALLVQHSGAAGAEATARRVLEALQQPFAQEGLSFTVTASIGIALYPNHGEGMDELVNHAAAAMRGVKQAGRTGFRFHQPQLPDGGKAVRTHMQLDHAMRLALAQGRFRLHYQPQVDIATGQVRGAEALLRWTDPVLGEVSPVEFIPVAEQSGLIVQIGDWVMQEAVRQAAQWHAQGLGLAVSVNVSALQFQQPGFVDGVTRALQDARLPAHLLELEITESILIHDASEAGAAVMRLKELSQLGVKLAIDDFGTGYSCLGYLKRFPIGRLKIDRSFVRGLPGDASDAGIVRAIINMGLALHLQIVAEGVETEEQRQFLQQAGCDQFQGFLYAPALEARAFAARVDADSAHNAHPPGGSFKPD